MTHGLAMPTPTARQSRSRSLTRVARISLVALGLKRWGN
jgi:hypothetical protein